MKKSNSPATTTHAYDEMIGRWQKIQTLLDGTEEMREAGRLYLPQHEHESDEAYAERRNAATLFNMTKLILNSWVGRPFSDPLVMQDDVPQEIRDLQDNIDLLGNAIQVFARNWFKEGLAKGVSHVMVEMPRTSGDNRTLADDRADGIRPYWVHIKPEQVFFADAVVINGEEVLTEIRMVEHVTVRDGFALYHNKQIRQYMLEDDPDTGNRFVSVTLYRQVPKKEDEWVKIDYFQMDIDRIPMVSFYSDREDLMMATPPIEDVADLNIAHWQSTSDQRACLTVARFPILTLTGGVDENGTLTIGPKKWLYTPDPNAQFKYLEHTGQAIETGRRDIQDLEAQMADYGSEYLKKRPGRETATARTLDSAEATSGLQDVTLRFIDAMQSVLAMTAKWLGLPNGGTVDITTDFAPTPAEAEGLRTLVELRKIRDVSHNTMIQALVRARVLPEDFSSDQDLIDLENEALSMPPVNVINGNQ